MRFEFRRRRTTGARPEPSNRPELQPQRANSMLAAGQSLLLSEPTTVFGLRRHASGDAHGVESALGCYETVGSAVVLRVRAGACGGQAGRPSPRGPKILLLVSDL